MGWFGDLAKTAVGFIPGVGPLARGLLGAGIGAAGGLLSRPKEDPRYSANNNYLNSLSKFGPPQTAGVDPLSQQAFRLMQHNATTPSDPSRFFNLYQQEVVDASNRDAQFAGGQALSAARDQGARSRVFGGSRAGIMGATALSGINRANMTNLANLRFGEYQAAVGAAQNERQMDMGAAGQLAGAGDYSRGITQARDDAPWQRAMQTGPLIAQQLAAGGQYQPRPSAFNAALGGALTGFGLFKKKPLDALPSWLAPRGPNVQQTTGYAPPGLRPAPTSFPTYGGR